MRGSGRVVGLVTCVFVLVGLVLSTGCAQSRAKDRLRVVEAVNSDLRQQNTQLADSAYQAQLEQDRALAQWRQARDEADVAQRQATEGQRAVQALDQSRQDNERLAHEIIRQRGEVTRLREAIAARQAEPAPPATAPQPESAPDVEAFRQDLQRLFSQFQVDGLRIEVRAMADGRLRVAVVLQNAFPSGKDSLAYNMDAVRAVVRLGQLISSAYPGSGVSVEGHTDSDPIRVSPFRDNEHLSLARAEEVRKLLARAGVPESQIAVTGHGARYPIAAGDTPRAKARNRRVEIYIEPSI